jgi:hypothetical protein
MTTPAELCRRAVGLGLTLRAMGDKLTVQPGNRCPPDFADELRQHKAELLQWLASPPRPGWEAVPPDNLALGTLPPRPTPFNRERVIAYLRRQTADRPGPLSAWLALREAAYYDGPGARWDCGLLAYAAARDAACWQLQRTEGEVWETLAGFDAVARLP